MRDRFLVVYLFNGEQHHEFCPCERVQAIKSFADKVLSVSFIG